MTDLVLHPPRPRLYLVFPAASQIPPPLLSLVFPAASQIPPPLLSLVFPAASQIPPPLLSLVFPAASQIPPPLLSLVFPAASQIPPPLLSLVFPAASQIPPPLLSLVFPAASQIPPPLLSLVFPAVCVRTAHETLRLPHPPILSHPGYSPSLKLNFLGWLSASALSLLSPNACRPASSPLPPGVDDRVVVEVFAAGGKEFTAIVLESSAKAEAAGNGTRGAVCLIPTQVELTAFASSPATAAAAGSEGADSDSDSSGDIFDYRRKYLPTHFHPLLSLLLFSFSPPLLAPLVSSPPPLPPPPKRFSTPRRLASPPPSSPPSVPQPLATSPPSPSETAPASTDGSSCSLPYPSLPTSPSQPPSHARPCIFPHTQFCLSCPPLSPPPTQVLYSTPPRFPPAILASLRASATHLFSSLSLRDCARLDGWFLPPSSPAYTRVLAGLRASSRLRGGSKGENDEGDKEAANNEDNQEGEEYKEGIVVFSDVNIVSGMEQTSFLFQQAALVGLSHSLILRYDLPLPLHPSPASPAVEREGEEGGGGEAGVSGGGRQLVWVLFGGSTAERQVSLISGTNVWLKLRACPQPLAFPLSHDLCPPFSFDVQPFLLSPSHDSSSNTAGSSGTSGDTAGFDVQPFLLSPSHDSSSNTAGSTSSNSSGNGPSPGSLSLSERAAWAAEVDTVWSLPYPAILRHTVEEVEAACIEFLLPVPPTQPTCLLNPSDLAAYVTAFRDAAPRLMPGQLSTLCGVVEMHLPVWDSGDACSPPNPSALRTFYRNRPHLTAANPTAREPAAGTCDNNEGLVWEGRRRWVVVTVGVVGHRGKMRALAPSVTVKEAGDVLTLEEKFQGGTGINLTPPPTSIISASGQEEGRRRIEMVASALNIDGCKSAGGGRRRIEMVASALNIDGVTLGGLGSKHLSMCSCLPLSTSPASARAQEEGRRRIEMVASALNIDGVTLAGLGSKHLSMCSCLPLSTSPASARAQEEGRRRIEMVASALNIDGLNMLA
ncbi:unnamed protein product [Closterium sp. Naga37s-1]|nr:unnamed protein product [Closterium sp. Naga37s-1]